MSKVTALIKDDITGYWLLVNGIEEQTAFAIEGDEIEAVRDACNEWLKKNGKII
ncbi:MAG: hypothetical protein NUV80_04950 [Candidatus Berkelbacteria bacterium]|nr:hypothetical protein [Candidatus Berkelbacteria bacterium]